MVKSNYDVLKDIKQLSWKNREKVLADKGKEFKFLSTYVINDLLQEPKDWDKIAQKAADGNNPKYAGMTKDEILTSWRTKSAKGAETGMTLDNYIQAKMNGAPIDMSKFNDVELAKCAHFDTTYEKYFKHLPLVGQEVWLTSAKLGVSVRLDCLLRRPQITDEVALLIAEWKNTENISTEDRWNKLQGPASHLDACEAVKYTFQVQIYRYILEELGVSSNIAERIFQFRTDGYVIHKPSFPYSASFIEKVVAYCFEERERRTLNKNKS